MAIPRSQRRREKPKPRGNSHSIRPLAVSVRTACALLGLGNAKMWELIKGGHIETIRVGRKRLVVYASLEELVEPSNAGRLT